MMGFIEQEAREKVEEIDAKVIKGCLSVSLVICAAATSNGPRHTHLFTGGGRVQHRERSSGADPQGENHGVL